MRSTPLFDEPASGESSDPPHAFLAAVESFRWHGRACARTSLPLPGLDGDASAPVFVNEFWTNRQRAAHSLHEISYRACFKPQLPRFFIDRLSSPSDVVYDPFMGRGTTLLEAALQGRTPWGCDINPLSEALVMPRLSPPSIEQVAERLNGLDLSAAVADDRECDLLAFYHPDTLGEIYGLRRYLLARAESGEMDGVDRWIRMVAINRLTGHSPGFFSVYTLPPNQATYPAAQRKINAKRNQTPPRRDVRRILAKKSRALLSDCDQPTRATLHASARGARIVTSPASSTPALADGAVALVVTSPPFLDVVDYRADNWLRCWFCGIDPEAVNVTTSRRLEDWRQAMTAVMHELARVLRRGGHVAFEVGEVRGGAVRLEETVVPCGVEAGLQPVCVMINDQPFTKTANCWGVENNRKGTNTNRIVVLRKP